MSKPVSQDMTNETITLLGMPIEAGHSYGSSPYPRTYSTEVTGTSFLDELKQNADNLYNKKIVSCTKNSPPSPAQIAKNDQTEAAYREFNRFYENQKTHQHFSQNHLESDLSQVSLTSEDVKDFLASIRAAFGFTTKDLADVLRIERQTIYAWQRDENNPSLENSHRVSLIKTYADKWNEFSKWPAKLMLRVAVEGTTLFEALCKDELDESQVLRVMKEAAHQIKNRETERSNTAQKKGDESHANTHFISEYDFLTLNAYLLE